MRTLYAQLLMHCEVANPVRLWEKFWENMADDVPARVADETGINRYYVNPPEKRGYVLYEIQGILNGFGKTL